MPPPEVSIKTTDFGVEYKCEIKHFIQSSGIRCRGTYADLHLAYIVSGL